MFFQDVKTRYKKLLIILLPIFIIFLVLVFFILRSLASISGTVSNSKEKRIDSMNYTLRYNATDYQIELFKELEEAVEEGDGLKISEAIAKNYIADTYTFTNKESKWDIGGMCFVYSRHNNSIYYGIRDSLYQLYEMTLEKYGKDGLMEVTEINVLFSKKAENLFEVEGNQYEAYNVGCSMHIEGPYEIVGPITPDVYFTIINNTDKNRYEIVELYGD